MKHIHFSALALFVMLSLQSMVGANPTGWFFNGSQEPAWGTCGDRNPNNATVTYANGIMKIVANGGNYYPQFNFPATDITANPKFKMRYKCTSSDYIFLKIELIKPGNPCWCLTDMIRKPEINSEGVWSVIEVTFPEISGYVLDDVNNMVISFRNGGGSFTACTVEIDEISLGTVSTGLKPTALDNVTLFPSIVKNELTITASTGNNVNVDIFSITGSKVLSTTLANYNGKTTLNVANLKAGSYLLNLNIDGKTAVQRFVKQ